MHIIGSAEIDFDIPSTVTNLEYWKVSENLNPMAHNNEPPPGYELDPDSTDRHDYCQHHWHIPIKLGIYIFFDSKSVSIYDRKI